MGSPRTRPPTHTHTHTHTHTRILTLRRGLRRSLCSLPTPTLCPPLLWSTPRVPGARTSPPAHPLLTKNHDVASLASGLRPNHGRPLLCTEQAPWVWAEPTRAGRPRPAPTARPRGLLHCVWPDVRPRDTRSTVSLSGCSLAPRCARCATPTHRGVVPDSSRPLGDHTQTVPALGSPTREFPPTLLQAVSRGQSLWGPLAEEKLLGPVTRGFSIRAALAGMASKEGLTPAAARRAAAPHVTTRRAGPPGQGMLALTRRQERRQPRG